MSKVEESGISSESNIFEEVVQEEFAHDSAAESEWSNDIPAEDKQRSCTIIGPANSGKTTLLLAMHQACLQEQSDQYKLDFVPESKTAAELMSLAGEFLFHGQTVRASSQITNYSFQIFVNNLEKQAPEYFCRLNVTDGPGGYLFPSERGSSNIGSSSWGSLVDATRHASSLVLCVDGSAPALETLYHGLPQLIFDLKGSNRRLPYDRALLLVTKIDRVVEEFHEHAAKYQQYINPSSLNKNPALESLCLGPGSPLNAARIARMMDPLEQTRNLFGRLIDMIQAGLAPSAKFAVGLCSALGFHAQTGTAFVNSTEPTYKEAGSLAARFRDWEPFGVREAILFLVDDLIQHPLYEVPKTTAGFSAKSRNVRVPLHV